MRDDLGYAYLIFAETPATLVGGLNISNVRRGIAQTASIGYWIGAPYAGRGLMTDAVCAVAQFAFATLRLNRLEAACLPTNAASARVLDKAGFRLRGAGAAIPQDRRPLAGPRPLRAAARRSATRAGEGLMRERRRAAAACGATRRCAAV